MLRAHPLVRPRSSRQVMKPKMSHEACRWRPSHSKLAKGAGSPESPGARLASAAMALVRTGPAASTLAWHLAVRKATPPMQAGGHAAAHRVELLAGEAGIRSELPHTHFKMPAKRGPERASRLAARLPRRGLKQTGTTSLETAAARNTELPVVGTATVGGASNALCSTLAIVSRAQFCEPIAMASWPTSIQWATVAREFLRSDVITWSIQ